MGDKSKEIECLNIAKSYCKKNLKTLKSAYMLLSGEDIERELKESPDFLKYYKKNSLSQKGIVVGIEHFRVDHYSKELSNGRVSSCGICYEKSVRELYQKWVHEVSNSEEIPHGALDDLQKVLEHGLKLKTVAAYNHFIESFDYSLKKHVGKIEKYCQVIDDHCSKNDDKKLVFLIEIHADFNNLFFHDRKGLHYKEGTIPLFYDIIKIIKSYNLKKIDYIIMCFGQTIYDSTTSIVVVRPKEIEKDLKKQNIQIYNYVGEDSFLQKFQSLKTNVSTNCSVEKNGDVFDICASVESMSMSDEQKMAMIICAYKKICEYKKQKINYATTYELHKFDFICGKYLKDNYNLKTIENFINYALNKGILYRDSDEFDNKWKHK